jgi:chemotaxis signal transduction protein
MSRISQRIANRRAEPLQKLIVFQIRQETFALPIQFAQKVVPLGLVYGVTPNGVGLTRYGDREIPAIDLEPRVFAAGSEMAGEISPGESRHLLVVEDAQGELLGIVLEAPPMLRRVPKSAFAPVPAVYLAEGQIRCISAIIAAGENEPPIFLLNLDQALERRSLPSSPEGVLPLLEIQGTGI